MISNRRSVLVLVGPTASGKTTLSLILAKALGGEIVSADSRQIYRNMSIGTAKPTKSEMSEVPHHCIDIRDPDQIFSAGEYAMEAQSAIRSIFRAGKTPLVVGGSGLYIRALVDGVFPGVMRNPEFRESLKDLARMEGSQLLHRQLSVVDPEAAGRIHPNDLKRIVRALEVYHATGRSITEMQTQETIPAEFSALFYGLRWDKETLRSRIRDRVDAMILQGLFSEVEKLLEMGFTLDHNSMNSVGYKESVEYLKGRMSQEEAIELIKQNTIRFAKRQMTWFRNDRRIHWLDVQEPVDWDQISPGILKLFNETIVPIWSQR